METDKHYFLVGSFVLLTILGLIAFSVWMLGISDEHKYTPYRIRFRESVSGLDIGGPVKFRGVQVGKVKDMVIDREDTRVVRVDISVLKNTPIKTDTVANLKYQGITGAVFIDLSGGSPQAEPLKAEGRSIPEIPSQTSALTQIMDIMPDILQKISHIAEQVDKAFNDRNIASYNDMVEQWQNISRDVRSVTRSLKEDPSRMIIPAKEKGIPAP